MELKEISGRPPILLSLFLIFRLYANLMASHREKEFKEIIRVGSESLSVTKIMAAQNAAIA